MFPYLVFVLFGTSIVWSQAPSSMTLSELQRQADGNLAAENYVAARPFLRELVKRFEQEDERTRANLGQIYYFIGLSYLQAYASNPDEKELKNAIKWFDRYEKEFPIGNFAVSSILARADCYRGLNKLGEAANDYIKLLSPPLDSKTNSKQRNEAYKKLIQSYYISKDWENGMPWFRRYYDESIDPDGRALAATAMVEAYIAKDEFKKVTSLFSEIVGNSPARYQLQFNVALMQAGNKLSKLKRYNEATFMYRMVLSVEEIIAFNEQRLGSIKSQLELLNVISNERTERGTELETEVFNLEAQLEALRGVKSYTSNLKTLLARNYLLTARDWEGFWAFERLVEEYPESESIEDFYYSAFAAATKIDYAERVISMGEEYLQREEWNKYRNDITIKLCRFYLKEERYDSFFKLSKKYVEERSDEYETGQIIYFLGSTYMKLGQYDEMAELFSSYTQKYKGAPIEDGCYYFLGMAQLFLKKYLEGTKAFNVLLQNYEQSPYREDAQYRVGICSFGLGDFEKAKVEFLKFVKDYPDTKLRGEAEFFLGDIYAGLSDVDAAIKHYSNVEKYTDNIAYVQAAYYQTGELLMAAQQYEKALHLYNKFVDNYSDQGEFTEAIFFMGVAHEMLGEPEKMLQVYLDAIIEHGDDPISYGLDKIIKSYSDNYYRHKEDLEDNINFLNKVRNEKDFRQLLADDRRQLFAYLSQNPGVYEEVKRPFYDATFRTELLTDVSPVDEMIGQYEVMWERYPKKPPEEELQEVLDNAVLDGKKTLEIRAQMALDHLNVELIPEPIFSAEDFDYGSPVTLIWMGDRISELDVDIARQAYQRVVDQHPESGEVFTALLSLGEIEEEFEDFGAALYYYRQAEELFPTREDVSTAIIKQGDILMKRGDYLEARDIFQGIVKNRQWRGDAHAEALYKIAECFEKENRPNEALGYYERVYIGYIAYYEWSSKAYLQAGRIYETLGELKKAKEIYTDFVQRGAFEENEPTALLIQKSLNALR